MFHFILRIFFKKKIVPGAPTGPGPPSWPSCPGAPSSPSLPGVPGGPGNRFQVWVNRSAVKKKHRNQKRTRRPHRWVRVGRAPHRCRRHRPCLEHRAVLEETCVVSNCSAKLDRNFLSLISIDNGTHLQVLERRGFRLDRWFRRRLEHLEFQAGLRDRWDPSVRTVPRLLELRAGLELLALRSVQQLRGGRAVRPVRVHLDRTIVIKTVTVAKSRIGNRWRYR